MLDPILPLPGLSPVSGKTVVAKFDGGLLSSDGGILVLREVEQRLRVADRLAACIKDPRSPDQITHSLADIIRFRLLMIAAGYEDGNDASNLRGDSMFKMALDLSPSDRELCSQSTISRLENLPDARTLLRMGRAMVDLYCKSFRQVPKRITLDIDDTFDAVHGGQQLRLFNAHYDEYGFQPIVIFDGDGRFITTVLRPAKRPGGKEIRAFLRRLLRAIRANWPNTEILLRADSHYCCPEVLDWCRANGLDYILGVAPTTTLRRHIEGLEASTKARFEAAPKDAKLRRFKEFFDGAASWSRVEQIIARVEVGAEGPDTRFVVTNLKLRNARVIYEDVYCRRGQAENHIKSWKTLAKARSEDKQLTVADRCAALEASIEAEEKYQAVVSEATTALVERAKAGCARTHALIVGVGDYKEAGIEALTTSVLGAWSFTEWILTRFQQPGRPLGSVELIASPTPEQGEWSPPKDVALQWWWWSARPFDPLSRRSPP